MREKKTNPKRDRPTSAKKEQKWGTDEKAISAGRGQKRGTERSRAKDEIDAGEQKAGKAPKKRSASLRGAARRVKQAIPDIVDRMLEEAKKGNVQHLKTVLHCTGVDKLLEQECKPKKQKSLAELLIRRLERHNETEESEGSRTESE